MELPDLDKIKFLEAQIDAIQKQIYRNDIDELIYKQEYIEHKEEMSQKAYEEKLEAFATDRVRFTTALKVMNDELEKLNAEY